MRGPHDLGGEPAGLCARTRHEPEDWERRVDATMMVLWRTQRFTVDEMRRHIESMSSLDYRRAAYYERWALALAAMLVEHGVLSAAEIAQRMEAAA